MNSIKSLISITLLFFITSSAFSQTEKENTKLSLDNSTINNQFEYLIKRSNNWKDQRGQSYEVIKHDWIIALKAHTLDSLKSIRKNLINTQAVVKKQAINISDLQKKLSNTELNLEKTNAEKNNMALFNMQISKSNYNIILWAIITALLVLLILFIYKYKNSNAITLQSKKILKDTEYDFEEHRKTALEREQKVRRQLQDEINKHKKGL